MRKTGGREDSVKSRGGSREPDRVSVEIMIVSSGATTPKRGAFILLEGVDRCGKVSCGFHRASFGTPSSEPLRLWRVGVVGVISRCRYLTF